MKALKRIEMEALETSKEMEQFKSLNSLMIEGKYKRD